MYCCDNTSWMRGWRQVALCFVLLLSGTLSVQAQEVQCEAVPGKYCLSLPDTDIRSLIKTVAGITKKNFVIDPRVKGKVSVVFMSPMDENGLYEVFLSTLQVHGFSAVKSGDVIKIVPEVVAKQSPIPVINGSGKSRGDTLVTRVVRIEHVPAAQLVPILRPLVPQNGQLAAYPPSNTLVISDSAANIERLIKIIRHMDREDDEQIDVVPLKFASADDMTRILNGLQKPGDQTGPGKLQISSDKRTNSILVTGEKAARKRVKDIIVRLDVPRESEGRTQVVYLKYAKAADLVNVLQGVSSTKQKADLAAGAITPATGGAGATGGGGGGSQVVNIQADEASNALIISAPPAMQQNLQAVIDRLDIRREQVLVEAIIAEVSTDLSKELGGQFGFNTEGIFGGSNFPGSNVSILNLNPTSLASTSLGIFGAGNLASGSKFSFLLKALSGDAATNILSTPTLVTMDNEEAEIVVGQNVPFVTGSFSSTGDNSNPTNPFQTIERRDVGLTLKVKPQINEGGNIKLNIEQEVSNLSSSSVNASDLITNKRSIKTNVIVEDGQILVLGGLIEDTFRDSEQKVPVLGDVPVLGNLFRYTNTTKQKQNLMAFIHPVILRDRNTASEYTNLKYGTLQRAQKDSDILERGLLDQKAASLPSMNALITQMPSAYGDSSEVLLPVVTELEVEAPYEATEVVDELIGTEVDTLSDDEAYSVTGF